MEILYQDAHLIAINKPPGIAVHRSDLCRSEPSYILQLLREQINQYLYPVHRLDKPTSGVLIFALSQSIAHALMQQFTNHEVNKTYAAIIRGFVEKEGIINKGLKRIDKKVSSIANAEQFAETSYNLESSTEINQPVGRYQTARYSYLLISPKTGRYHQIRRHMSHIRHPVIGDTKYGDRFHNRFFRDQLNLPHLLLSAIKLEFRHPVTNEMVCFTCQPNDSIQTLLKTYHWIKS